MLQSKGNLGVAQVDLVIGASVHPIVILPRSHLKFFGVQLFPNASLSLGSLASFTRHVYNDTRPFSTETFYTHIPQREAFLLAGSELVLNDTLPPSFDATWAKKRWHHYLCTQKLWPRFCYAEDVNHYLTLPLHHAGKSLTRAELEMMEASAKVRQPLFF